MHFELNGRSLQQIATRPVPFAGGATRLWFPDQSLGELADPRLFGTVFLDSGLVAPRAVQRIVEAARTLPTNGHGWGGKKVRDHATWNMPEMTLLTQRALLSLCIAQGTDSAHVVDRWANVIEHGDYSGPHSHYESEWAVVYFLDPGGDPDSEAAATGQFELIDPRIPFCCPDGPERPTRGICPSMSAGTLLLFPAPFLHHVRPYFGDRPRITLAWNISAGPPPADLRDPGVHVAAKINSV